MLTKAYIQSVLSPHSVRIRVPLYNKTEDVQGATPNDELHTACVCTLPNFIIDPQEGDIVIVGFEEDDVSHPVVLGYLSKVSEIRSKVDIVCQSLKVENDVTLSDSVTIGDIKPENIKCLEGLNDNIKDTFTETAKEIKKLKNTDTYMARDISRNTEQISEIETQDIAPMKKNIDNIISKITNYKEITIGQEEPTIENLAENQIYLWVQT